jgi:hypothetical protein
MRWKVTEIPYLKGYTVEWAEPGNFILSRRNRLYRTASLDRAPEPAGVISAPGWKQAAANFRPAQRLLRFMVTNVVRQANGDLFVTFDKSVGIITGGEYRELKGLVRPCRVLRSACALDSSGNIFFGEYLANDERGEMRIYRYTPGSDTLEVAHTFPPNSIKHIHGLYYDRFTDSIVSLTGDADSECRMLRSSDGFRTVETIGEGDESWRAVSLLFGRENFYYGTDAEFRANQIFKLDRQTLDRETLGEVSGTVFYSKQVGDDLFFTTTAENAPSQKENVAALWNVAPDGGCVELAKFQKDGWHGTLFMFGTIHFPYENKVEDTLYFSVVGVKGDNKTFSVVRTDRPAD